MPVVIFRHRLPIASLFKLGAEIGARVQDQVVSRRDRLQAAENGFQEAREAHLLVPRRQVLRERAVVLEGQEPGLIRDA